MKSLYNSFKEKWTTKKTLCCVFAFVVVFFPYFIFVIHMNNQYTDLVQEQIHLENVADSLHTAILKSEKRLNELSAISVIEPKADSLGLKRKEPILKVPLRKEVHYEK